MELLERIEEGFRSRIAENPDFLEQLRETIKEQSIANAANHDYYVTNKELFRKLYAKNTILIYNEKVIAVADSTEEICEKWFDLVDERHRFHAVIIYVPEVNAIFI